MTPRGTRSLALLLALLAAPALAEAQEGGVILEVRLPSVGSVVVEGEGTMDEPLLPAAPVFDLVGRDTPAGLDLVTVERLESELGVEVEYYPRRALVLIQDTYSQLPASQASLDTKHAEGRARPSALQFRRGPFGSVAAAEDGEYLTTLGWNFGRFEAAASTSREGGDEWRASLNPFGNWWVSYQDGSDREPQVDARLNVGRTFATLTYTPTEEEIGARVNAGIGPFSVALQDRDVMEGLEDGIAVVTWRGDPVAVTVARTGTSEYIGRLSFGRRTSFLAVPRVR